MRRAGTRGGANSSSAATGSLGSPFCCKADLIWLRRVSEKPNVFYKVLKKVLAPSLSLSLCLSFAVPFFLFDLVFVWVAYWS